MVSFVSSYLYTANTLPDIKNEDFIKECVQVHNKKRSEVNPAARNMLHMVRKLSMYVACQSKTADLCYQKKWP
jgi:hypothetical protein